MLETTYSFILIQICMQYVKAMSGRESNLAGIYNVHDGFLSKNLQHMVFRIQQRAQEPQYVFEHISNSSFKFLLLAIWPTELQMLPSFWQKVKVNGCENSVEIYKAIHLPSLLLARMLQILSP